MILKTIISYTLVATLPNSFNKFLLLTYVELQSRIIELELFTTFNVSPNSSLSNSIDPRCKIFFACIYVACTYKYRCFTIYCQSISQTSRGNQPNEPSVFPRNRIHAAGFFATREESEGSSRRQRIGRRV